VERLQDVEKELRNGDAKVFDTEKFTVDGSSLETLAEDDADFKKYAKNIKGGEYKESGKRSAPSMEFFVDGVEESTYNYLGDEEIPQTADQSPQMKAAALRKTLRNRVPQRCGAAR